MTVMMIFVLIWIPQTRDPRTTQPVGPWTGCADQAVRGSLAQTIHFRYFTFVNYELHKRKRNDVIGLIIITTMMAAVIVTAFYVLTHLQVSLFSDSQGHSSIRYRLKSEFSFWQDKEIFWHSGRIPNSSNALRRNHSFSIIERVHPGQGSTHRFVLKSKNCAGPGGDRPTLVRRSLIQAMEMAKNNLLQEARLMISKMLHDYFLMQKENCCIRQMVRLSVNGTILQNGHSCFTKPKAI